MLTIVGTIRIAGGERLAHLRHNLRSMEPIADLLRWDFNVAGEYAKYASEEIKARWPTARITINDDAPAYPIMWTQLHRLAPDGLAFFWLEDHWYICQDTPAFRRVLEQFAMGKAEVLTISHLVASWEQKRYLPVDAKTDLFTVYRADLPGYERAWAEQPGSYAAGIPMICKYQFANAMLEHVRDELKVTGKPAPFELPPHKARPFLEAHPFYEVVPEFHVFREVFRQTRNPRGMLWSEAEKIIEDNKR